jgi:hypothetical protein
MTALLSAKYFAIQPISNATPSVQDKLELTASIAAESRETAVRNELIKLGWLPPEEVAKLRQQAAYYTSLGGTYKPGTVDNVEQ